MLSFQPIKPSKFKNSDDNRLMVMFSERTSKLELPLRVFVSERGTRQAARARFLQRKLRMFDINYASFVKSSDEVVDFLTINPEKVSSTCIIDVGDILLDASKRAY